MPDLSEAQETVEYTSEYGFSIHSVQDAVARLLVLITNLQGRALVLEYQVENNVFGSDN